MQELDDYGVEGPQFGENGSPIKGSNGTSPGAGGAEVPAEDANGSGEAGDAEEYGSENDFCEGKADDEDEDADAGDGAEDGAVDDKVEPAAVTQIDQALEKKESEINSLIQQKISERQKPRNII